MLFRLTMEKLNWRERKALRSFDARDVIYTFQLPRDVSHKTMAGLVGRGMLAVVNAHKGRFSMDYGWMFVELVVSKAELQRNLALFCRETRMNRREKLR